jgi:hypothetical protein
LERAGSAALANLAAVQAAAAAVGAQLVVRHLVATTGGAAAPWSPAAGTADGTSITPLTGTAEKQNAITNLGLPLGMSMPLNQAPVSGLGCGGRASVSLFGGGGGGGTTSTGFAAGPHGGGGGGGSCAAGAQSAGALGGEGYIAIMWNI